MRPFIEKYSQLRCGDRVYDSFKQGCFLYVANGGLGLQVVDYSNPRQPMLVNQIKTIGRPRAICVKNNYVFVAEEHVQGFGIGGALEVFDVSNPSYPIQLGFNNTPSYAYDVICHQGLIYLADEASGLHIFRMNSYGILDRIGLCNGFGNAKRLYAYRDTVYMVDRVMGLIIYSVTDPANPKIIGTCNIPQDNFGVCLHQGRAIVANRYSGLYFVNIDNPGAPFIERVEQTGESNIDVVSDNKSIFVSSMDMKVPGIKAYVQESSNRLSPVYDIDTNGNLWALTLCDDFLFGSNGDYGIIALKISY